MEAKPTTSLEGCNLKVEWKEINSFAGRMEEVLRNFDFKPYKELRLIIGKNVDGVYLKIKTPKGKCAMPLPNDDCCFAVLLLVLLLISMHLIVAIERPNRDRYYEMENRF
ncbi:hypothetical protein AB6A40_000541 [Gnathostoma spinigerum]|uniref:Uncharacterized protein n=1 Tax=Gnathostoma spinigerum TaxID=75299 RepID=A0ABD6EAX3_9BILA